MANMITIKNKKTGKESEVTEEKLKALQANELLGNLFVVVGGKVPAEVKAMQKTDAKPAGSGTGNGMASESAKQETKTS